jgi:hypothetical protein
MTDWNAVSAFMANAVAWPRSPSDPGFVNLHFSMPSSDPKRKFFMGGWPLTDVTNFVNKAAWINTVPDKFKDVWFCTSLQSAQGVNTKGKPKAIRLAANALKQKAIWIDVDVDADPKHYGTVEEALKAVLLFAKTVGLPMPSAVVNSGGGIHVYWISKDELSPAEWLPYASGLKQLLLANDIKCDAGLTTDIARILRVPGTFNHKYNPPKPVTLAPLPLTMYEFKKLDFLKEFAAPMAAPPQQAQRSIFAEGVDPSSFGKPHPLFDSIKGEPGLNAGIDKGGEQPLDPRPIFRDCGFYREARSNGGKDYDQLLWMYSVLGATFMEDGRSIAHAISKGHASYSPADTDGMYDRKLAERQGRRLGYPKCSTIQGAGCKACATCPHLAKAKSPLNLALPSAVEPPDEPPDDASGPAELRFSLSDVPPHRPWLYSVDLVRGDLSVLASPGGAGKTSLALGMAICVALGKPLLGEQIWGSGPFTSLYINAEDSGIEMRRRARAFCQQHTITDLDRLYIAGTDDPRVRGLSLLRAAGQNSTVLNPDGLAHLDSLLASLRPDLVIIDPLIALCGGISINDNAAMALAMQEIKRLAIKFNCSILIVCHTKKGGEPGSAEAISGASAIKDLARCARMPVTMTATEATKFSVLPSERHQHFKLVDAKSNLALHTDDTWYKLESQELPNSELPTYPRGDRVQAVVRVKLTQSKASSAADPEQQRIRFEILKLIDRGLMIEGERVLYSPNSTGKNKIRGILDDAMAAVERVSEDREYSPSDLRAVAERELEALKQEGWATVEKIRKGRFRRTQGLRPVWERTPWAKEREILREHGGPTVRTEEEEAEWKRRDLDEFLQDVTPPSG